MCHSFALLSLTPSIFAVPIVVFPINSQVPPVARVSEPFHFIFSASTFSSGIGNVSYALDGAPAWLQLDSSGRTFSGTPTPADVGSANFSLVASDRDGPTSMPVTLVTSTGPGPGIGIDVASQLSSQGSFSTPDRLILAPLSPINISFSRDTFTHTNENTVYYAICANNTPLPSWLHFDPFALTFSGTSPQLDTTEATSQDYGIHMIASDVIGFSGAVAGFQIIVETHLFTFKGTLHTLRVSGGENLVYSEILADLSLDGNPVSATDLTQATASTPPWLSLNTSSLALSGTAPPDIASQNITVTVTDKYGDEVEAVISIDSSPQASVSSAAGTSTNGASIQTDNSSAPTASPNAAADHPAQHHVTKRRWIVAAVIGPLALFVALLLFWCCSRKRQRRRRSTAGLITSIRNMRNPGPFSEKKPPEQYQVIRPQTPRRPGGAPFQSVVCPPPPRVELGKRLSRWRWSGLDFQRRHSQHIEPSTTTQPFHHATVMEKGKILPAAPMQSARNLGLRDTHSWLSLSSGEPDPSASPSPPKRRKRKRKRHSTSTWAGSSGPLNTLRKSVPVGYGHGRIIDPTISSPFGFSAQAQQHQQKINLLPGCGHGSGIPNTGMMSYIRQSWQKASSQSSWTSTSGATTTTSTGSRIRMPGSQKSQDLTVREWPRPPGFRATAFDEGLEDHDATLGKQRRTTVRLVGGKGGDTNAAANDLNLPTSKQAYIKQRAKKRNRENALFAAGPSARLSSLSKIGRPRMMVQPQMKAVSRMSISSAYSQPVEEREEGSPVNRGLLQREESPPKIPLPPSVSPSRASSPTRSRIRSRFGSTTVTARAILAKRSLSRLRSNQRNSTASSVVPSPERNDESTGVVVGDEKQEPRMQLLEEEEGELPRIGRRQQLRSHSPSPSLSPSTLVLPSNPFRPTSSSSPPQRQREREREAYTHSPYSFNDLFERRSSSSSEVAAAAEDDDPMIKEAQ